MKKFYLFNVLIFFCTVNSFGQTTIQDEATVSGTWTVANSPYIVEGRAVVPNGQTLNIEAGVEVRLRSSASTSASWFDYEEGNVGVLRIQGELIANGTPENPILFTRNNNGEWGTILIDENSSPNSSMTHCIVEFSNQSRNITGINSTTAFIGGVSIYKSSIIFQNNTLSNNRNTGLFIREVSSLFEFSNNKIFDNSINGVVISESVANGINNSIYNNSNGASGVVSGIQCSFSEVSLIGNLIYNNDDFGIFNTGAGNVSIVNNTIVGNSQGIRVEDDANTFITNTIVQNNETNFVTGGTIGEAVIEMQYSLTDDISFPENVSDVEGNILNSDAEFTNLSSNDFSLLETSPSIDSGIPDTSGFNIPEEDVLENPRVVNAIIDIGAVEFQDPLSNEEFDRSSSIKIYPNPTIGEVTIEIDDPFSVKVFDINGKLILDSTKSTIDLSSQPSGIYMLKIESSTGLEINKRLIKN